VAKDVPLYTQPRFRSRKRGASATGEKGGEGMYSSLIQDMIEANDHINCFFPKLEVTFGKTIIGIASTVAPLIKVVLVACEPSSPKGAEDRPYDYLFNRRKKLQIYLTSTKQPSTLTTQSCRYLGSGST
jgi:hypothetical protein